MSRAAIFDALRTRIAQVFEVDPDDVEESSFLVNDFDADSIDLLELILGLRDTFGITIDEGEVKEFLVELARFVPDVAVSNDYSDAELAEITRRLQVSTIVDFVQQKVGASIS